MSTYRDERDALRARLEELERELTELREGPDREEAKRQLAALSAKVAEATAKLDGERAALGEVAASIQKLTTSLGGSDAAAPAGPKAGEAGASGAANGAGSGGGMFAFLGISVAILATGYLMLRSSASSAPDDPFAAVRDLPGAPHAVDPVALLPRARLMARSMQYLVSIEARYVASTGLVDLRAPTYMGTIAYTFGERPPDPAPNPSAPLGAPAPRGGMPSQAKVVVDLQGMKADPVLLGFSGQEVPEPKCTLAQVWSAARGAGAPEGAVAIVTYQRDPLNPLSRLGRREPREESAQGDSGNAWIFHIDGTQIRLRIEDPTCRVTSTTPGL